MPGDVSGQAQAFDHKSNEFQHDERRSLSDGRPLPDVELGDMTSRWLRLFRRERPGKQASSLFDPRRRRIGREEEGATSRLLASASAPRYIGDQAGGRVFLFFRTDN